MSFPSFTSTSLANLGKRIVVVGTAGAGKTYVASRLAMMLGFPHIESDSLCWEKGWALASDEIIRERVQHATSGESWIADGNYSIARDLVWGKAQTIVWLDYRSGVVAWQLFKRTFVRLVTRETLWNGNRESLNRTLLSKDSIFVWALRTHQKKRKEHMALLNGRYKHLRLVHLHSPRQTQIWLSRLSRDQG